MLCPRHDVRSARLSPGSKSGYATRGIEYACTSSAFATVIRRTRDAYGGSCLLGSPNLRRSRTRGCGPLLGRRLGDPLCRGAKFVRTVRPSQQLAVPGGGCVLPPCHQAAARPAIPTLIFIGALDDWTPAADCSNKVAAWGNDGPPIELVVYPGAHHSFYYPHLQPRQDHVGSLAGIQR